MGWRCQAEAEGLELGTRFLLRVSGTEWARVYSTRNWVSCISFAILLNKLKKVCNSSTVGFKKTLCLITSCGIDECKTQFRGSWWRRQVANYSSAMTQWHSFLEQFAAADLRSFLF